MKKLIYQTTLFTASTLLIILLIILTASAMKVENNKPSEGVGGAFEIKINYEPSNTIATAEICEEEATPYIVTTPETNAEKTPIEMHEESATDNTPEWVSYGTFRITAYCPCEKCCYEWAYNRPTDENGEEIVYTASGEIAEQGRTIAVDPDVIPYGSKVKIEGVGEFIAEDAGVYGNHIDVYFTVHDYCSQIGLMYSEVYIWQ